MEAETETEVDEMANPLYEAMMGPRTGQVPQTAPAPSFMNPVQKMQCIMQAMQNPAAFVKQALPDIPDQIANDPNQILQYLQQTRGITNQQIQQILGAVPYRR